jgi:hypothetical protein
MRNSAVTKHPWVFDDLSKEWIHILDGVRVSQVDFKEFEKNNHTLLRSIAGQERLDRYRMMQQNVQVKQAQPRTKVPDNCVVCGGRITDNVADAGGVCNCP